MNLNSIIKFIIAICYYPWIKIFRRGPFCVVLYYHGVSDEDLNRFIKQMQYLKNYCHVISPCSIPLYLQGTHNGNAVAITFDDGFVNVLDNAIPVLEEHHLPAGIFVPTSCIRQKANWTMATECHDYGEPIMSANQIIHVSQLGYDVYSHTSTHCPLAECDINGIYRELTDSKKYLEELLGHKMTSISYPHGSVNTNVIQIAREIGYTYGYTIEPSIVNKKSDTMQWGRISVSFSDSMSVFRLKTTGAYEIECFMRKLKSLAFISLKKLMHSRKKSNAWPQT